MKKINKGFALLACSALFGLSLSGAVSAADVAKLVEPCIACHGKDGVSTEADVPSIASYSELYMVGSLNKYQKKERPCVETEIRSGSNKGSKTSMCKSAQSLSENDIQLIAAYFAEKTFVATPQVFDAALAKKGKQVHNSKCDTCHSMGGTLASDDAGILGGQKMSYLRNEIKKFKEGIRPINKKMKPKLEALDDSEIEALIHFYGSVQ